jgi:hypothetical protein
LSAREGKQTSFYGLKGVDKHLPRIQTLLEVIQSHALEWTTTIETTLNDLFPGEYAPISVYPIIGYDMGIGMNSRVCMNLNHAAYLGEPLEFLFYIIHECTHVIYERTHQVSSLAEVATSTGWLRYFKLWLQNEGYAVYAPLRLRESLGCLNDPDYLVLFDKQLLESYRASYLEALKRLQSLVPLTRQEYLEICFGPQRLTYRIGCELIRRIESSSGLESVRQAFLMECNDFFESYRHLLGT